MGLLIVLLFALIMIGILLFGFAGMVMPYIFVIGLLFVFVALLRQNYRA